MAKRTEDEIQRKLVELEVAMKQEQAVKAAEATSDELEDAIIVSDDSVSNTLSRVEAKIAGKEKKAKKKSEVAPVPSASAELYQLGGYASLTAGMLILISHIRVVPIWPMHPAGLTLIPLLIGIGMLIYNYKSRVAQIVAAASFMAVIFGVITSFTLTFFPLSLLDLIILTLPLVFGVVLLAKANVKRREARESTKLIQ